MLRSKSNNTSENKTVERNSSFTEKFPGLGLKMQKLLRVFHKNEQQNLSASTQKLVGVEEGLKNYKNNKLKKHLSDNEGEIQNDNENVIFKSISETKSNTNNRTSNNSGSNSNGNNNNNNNRKKIVKEKRKMLKRSQALSNSDWSSENDFGSTTNLVHSNMKIDDEEIQNIEDDKIDDDDIHKVSNSNVKISKNHKKISKLNRSDKVQSKDEEMNKPMDVVVVDIHQENDTNKPLDDDNIIEVLTVATDNDNSNDENKNQLTSVNREKNSSDSGRAFNLLDSSGSKKQRKRWSTDRTSVISLPRKASGSSSTSYENNSWGEKAFRPIPAPRSKGFITDHHKNNDHNVKSHNKHKIRSFGVINHGFDPAEDDDNNSEQVLRIETEYSGKSIKNMKIEMESARSDSGNDDNDNNTINNNNDVVDDIPEIERLSEHSSMSVCSIAVNENVECKEKKNIPKPKLAIDSNDDDNDDVNNKNNTLVHDSVTLIDDRKTSSSQSPPSSTLHLKKTKLNRKKKLIEDTVTTDESTSSMILSGQKTFNENKLKDNNNKIFYDGAINKLTTRQQKKEKKEKDRISDQPISSSSSISRHGGRKHGNNKSASEIPSQENRIKSDTNTAVKVRRKRDKKKLEKTRKVKYISITIFKADMLEADFMTRHPMVIVHIVEEKTGNYLKVPNELSGNKKSFYLQPLITGMFDFKENKSMVPHWEEELIFEYDFRSIINGNDNDRTIILFEIVDLPSFADASNAYDHFGGGSCWHKIAWAFLKPASNNGTQHINKLVRLQLYKPKKNTKRLLRQKCAPYTWWKMGYRDKYPSTLYVTIMPVAQPQLEPVYYGQLSLNEFSDEQTKSHSDVNTLNRESTSLRTQSRLNDGDPCKIPNEIFFKTETSENGCFFIAFSNNGKYLACANCEEYDYPIVIYKIDDEKVYHKLNGHKCFIYHLDWSKNDYFILSVSSDQTAKIWDIENKIIHEINMLPHPAHVYSGKFNPQNWQIIVTGCYDNTPRIWCCKKNYQNYELLQELDDHKGFINAICFMKDSDFLTGDSVGVIIQWTPKRRRNKTVKEWQKVKKIKLKELDNVVINSIILHPTSAKLIIHSRDSQLRMIDLTTGGVIQRYEGLQNSRIQITAKISPCGKFLFCGSEDAVLNVWSIESGKFIAVYQQNHLSSVAITCVDYHPHNHVLAFCVFGCTTEGQILHYNKQLADGKSVGLTIIDELYNNNHNDNDNNGQINDKKMQSLDAVSLLNSSEYSRRVFSDLDSKLNDNDNEYADDDNRDDLKLRMKIFNESENQLKSRSINRLSGIIAKIDKILLNNASSTTHRLSNYNIEANIDNGMELNYIRSPITSNLRESKNFPTLESEMHDIKYLRTVSRRKKHRRNGKNKMDDTISIISEYPTINKLTNNNYRKKAIENTHKSNVNYEQIIHDDNDKNDVIVTDEYKIKDLKNMENNENKDYKNSKKSYGNCSDVSDGGGTYTLEKNGKDDNSDDTRIDSGSSLHSDGTFIVENRKTPVPKPRKKLKISTNSNLTK